MLLISLWIINFYIRFTLRAMKVSYETILHIFKIVKVMIPTPNQFSVAMPTVHFLNTPNFARRYTDSIVQNTTSNPTLFIDTAPNHILPLSRPRVEHV